MQVTHQPGSEQASRIPAMLALMLVFSMAVTTCVLAGIRLEEHARLEMHPEYRAYRRLVPMIFPIP